MTEKPDKGIYYNKEIDNDRKNDRLIQKQKQKNRKRKKIPSLKQIIRQTDEENANTSDDHKTVRALNFKCQEVEGMRQKFGNDKK